MKKTLSHIAALILGGGIMFGATDLTQNATVVDATTDKQAILKQYVEAEVRLGEVPTLDLSTASVDEMTQAYSDLAVEQATIDPKQPNLFDALHEKAVADGIACQPLSK